MDFIEGKDYIAYDADGRLLGSVIGDEFVRSTANKLLYRIDDQAVYSLDIPTKLLGFIEGERAVGMDGRVLFTLQPEKK